MNENVKNAKAYVLELFSGASKIVSFCKVHDCSMCRSSTKLYNRVFDYHNTNMVMNEFSEHANSIQNLKRTN